MLKIGTKHQKFFRFSDLKSIIQNNVHSTPIHEKTGTRRNALICRPHSLLELPDLCDSSKLCGLQIGIVEVVYSNDYIIFLGVR